MNYLLFPANNIDNNTIVIAIAGYLIVFFALLLLYLFFHYLPLIINLKLSKIIKNKSKKGIVNSDHILGEETAAIAMALYMYLDELHDVENAVLTIKKTSRTYSPWSSKIYAVRNQFNRI